MKTKDYRLPPIPSTQRIASTYLFLLPIDIDRLAIIRDWLGQLEVNLIDQVWLSETDKISIKEIRELQHMLNLAPIASHYRVGIMPFAERLTLEASHALLKSLEDPPTHAVYILVSQSEEQILPTILSRAQRWRVASASHSREKLASTSMQELRRLPYRDRFRIADEWTKGDNFLREFDNLLDDARTALLGGHLSPDVVQELLTLRKLATTNVTPRLLAEVVMLTLGKE